MSFAKYMIKGDAIQTTFGIVKPDGVRGGGLMAVKLIAERGLVVATTRFGRLSLEDAGHFYCMHREQKFFNGLLQQMTSGPILSMIIVGPHAVAKFREILGATDPTKADEFSLRGLYGTEMPNNAFHGSDSVASAEREIDFMHKNGYL
jgi:nucleoside-diphosphate kinase